MMVRHAVSSVALLLLSACGGAPAEREGRVEIAGGSLWYRVVGSGDRTPLLVLHGGPGGLSCELAGLAALADERPVIFYDQRGSGRSTIATDTTRWTLPQFVADLHALRTGLGLERLHLYGHSWGGALAVEYLLTHGTDGIASLTLGSPLVSTPRWLRITDSLLGTLPPGSREIARRNEAAGMTDDAAYQQVVTRFDERFGRRGRVPGEVAAACAGAGETNWQLARHLWGPSEFHADGALATFDRFDRLGALRLPARVIVGEYDHVPPTEAAAIAQAMPMAEAVVIPGAAHMAMQDAPAAYVAALRRFLREVERR